MTTKSMEKARESISEGFRRQRQRVDLTPLTETGLKGQIGKRMLAAYSALIAQGTKVEFHYLKGHSGLTRNEVADKFARYTRLQYFGVIPCSLPIMTTVFPLETAMFTESWRAERQAGKLPYQEGLTTLAQAQASLGKFKHMRYNLTNDMAPKNISPREVTLLEKSKTQLSSRHRRTRLS